MKLLEIFLKLFLSNRDVSAKFVPSLNFHQMSTSARNTHPYVDKRVNHCLINIITSELRTKTEISTVTSNNYPQCLKLDHCSCVFHAFDRETEIGPNSF